MVVLVFHLMRLVSRRITFWLLRYALYEVSDEYVHFIEDISTPISLLRAHRYEYGLGVLLPSLRHCAQRVVPR